METFRDRPVESLLSCLWPTGPCEGASEAEVRPVADGCGAVDHMHASGLEALERSFGLRCEVSHEAAAAVRHRHRGHAVAEDVDLGGEIGIPCQDFIQDIVDAALDAVAGSLAGDHQGIGLEEGVQEQRVLLRQGLAIVPHEHFRPQHRVVLGERVAALDLAQALAEPRQGVEEPGFVDDTAQDVTVAAEQAVGRPEVELVLAGALELLAVELDLPYQPLVIAVHQHAGDGRIGRETPLPDVVGGDDGVRRRLLASFVQPEPREENLEGEVGVQRRGDLSNHAEIAVDELGDAPVVIDRAGAGTACDVERPFWVAEVLLQVDQQQVELEGIAGGCIQLVLCSPIGSGFTHLPLVGPVVPVGRVGGVPQRRQGKG